MRPQECGVDDHRVAGIERGGGPCAQARIGAPCGGRRVDLADHGGRGRVERLQAEQALALDVRAQAYGARSLQQSRGDVALAGARQAVRDEQARVARRGQPPRGGDIVGPRNGHALGLA
ncbi:hypothetical protein GALL_278810 [mine drainage metagenome]|uniref:Uncharacterized protein n=1 Tax=mine drainage metagenome TaxID=410659 RepID=A0A1J5R474_9ZZZZ